MKHDIKLKAWLVADFSRYRNRESEGTRNGSHSPVGETRGIARELREHCVRSKGIVAVMTDRFGQ